MKFQPKSMLYSLLIGAMGVTSCQDNNVIQLTVENQLDFNRNEVISINRNDLCMLLEENSEEHLRVRKKGTDAYLRTQWIDDNQDGVFDELLFQSDVGADGTAHYELIIDQFTSVPESDVVAYSRFVPERTDDYTCENDKVAFRTYGPTGQREALEGVPGSTLSSGIDLWLKRMDKAIIDKWYAAHQESPGYYHIDHGEGYDPYHVGKSRGTGGIGVWEDDSLYVSRNFTNYKTIADGPLRTVFELSYAPWSQYNVNETKKITLDLGSNFSKIELNLSSEGQVPNYAIGITLHENEGKVKLNKKVGWSRHWEEIDGSHVGEGIIVKPGVVDSVFAQRSDTPDQSNLLVLAKPKNNLTYYAGFAWTKSGQIATADDWDTILERQVQVLNNPLRVTLNQ